MTSPSTMKAPLANVPSAGARSLAVPEKNGSRRRGRRVLTIGALAAIAVAGVVSAGALLQRGQEQPAPTAAGTDTVPRVTVAVARASPADNERVLPGSALPLLDAS